MSLHNLHRRLDRIDGNHGELHGLVESLERASREHRARQTAWTAAGHVGEPAGRQLSTLSPNASYRDRQLWRRTAEGLARVIFGKEPAACRFASLQEVYALDDDAASCCSISSPVLSGGRIVANGRFCASALNARPPTGCAGRIRIAA